MLPRLTGNLPRLFRSRPWRGYSPGWLPAIGPRILPFTIVAMALLLLVKLADLVVVWAPESTTRSVVQAAATLFAPAHAAGSEAAKPEAGKPEAGKPEAGKPEAGKPEAGKAETAKAEPGKSEPGKETAEAKPGEGASAVAPGATSGSAARPIGEVAAALGPGMSDSERALLTDLRTRRQELDKREAALAQRAHVLTAAEGRLAARLDEMKILQARLETLEKARQTQTDANWRGLVKVYEDMKPRDAATICNDLDNDVLIPVLDRMKDAKAAVLLAAMDPVKAREATALLAKRRAQATIIPPAPTAAASPAAPREPSPSPAAPAAGTPPAPAGGTPGGTPGAAPGAGAPKGAEAPSPSRRTSL